MAKNPKEVFSVQMVLDRQTKGAVRYAEVGDGGKPVEREDAKIGMLYIRKAAVGGEDNAPKNISVLVTSA